MTQLLKIGPKPTKESADKPSSCASGACGSAPTPRDPAPALDLLQAIADPVRWTVLERLADGTHCVCDLQAHVDVSNTLLSYHLRILRDAGLVTTSRRGRWVDYTLATDALARLTEALPAASSLVSGSSAQASSPSPAAATP
ncbi:ArsR/SmtB family transcription factor [Demequina salsinemoris]|uniref:ArsR/SmtB family transcription factor n=1 Tax=Demequina salsinemoris TaxID=577470 RepID=UPI000AA5CBCF|nr:metalloregulator ArsR/SmtB family transcription factor [Demequina salsinemoris]